AELLAAFFTDPDGDSHRIVRIAEEEHVAVLQRDFPARRRVDGDSPAIALDRGAVRGAQIAEDEVLADLRDLRVIAREVVIAEDDGARGRAADRGRAPARENAMQRLRRSAVKNL